MTNIKNFNALSILLAERGVKKRIVVVNPDDESTLWALDKARRSGFCETIIVDDDDRPTAARKAVQLVREGKADVLMKGFINTDVLLHAILNKEYGILEPGSVMTHITAASLLYRCGRDSLPHSGTTRAASEIYGESLPQLRHRRSPRIAHP